MKTKRLTVMILCLALCLVMGGESILSAFSITASAEESEIKYTNCYNDLISDQSFAPENYPKLSKADEKYYSLELITIAESENGELFVYVYQPSGSAVDIHASSIDFSTKDRTEKQFKHYTLTYINSYGVFYKYKVNDFVVSSAETRYYEISDILRPWSEDYGDEKPGGDNTISEMPFAVGKQFTFTTNSNGSTSMNMEDIEYIMVTDKYCGYIRWEQDAWLADSAADVHFVAFSTDRPIDKLLEADVYYEKQKYTFVSVSGYVTSEWGEIQPAYAYLDHNSELEIELSDGSVFRESFKLVDQIQKTTDFVSMTYPMYLFPGFSVSNEIPFTDEAKAELAKTEWVLTFDKTENWITGDGTNVTQMFTRVGNVKLLRLKFQTAGVIYDLGVVDNMQTGSKDPAAVVEEQDWWQKIVMLLLVILLVVLLSFLEGPIGAFCKVIWNGIKFIFRLLFAIITFPFRLPGMIRDFKTEFKSQVKDLGKGKKKAKK